MKQLNKVLPLILIGAFTASFSNVAMAAPVKCSAWSMKELKTFWHTRNATAVKENDVTDGSTFFDRITETGTLPNRTAVKALKVVFGPASERGGTTTHQGIYEDTLTFENASEGTNVNNTRTVALTDAEYAVCKAQIANSNP